MTVGPELGCRTIYGCSGFVTTPFIVPLLPRFNVPITLLYYTITHAPSSVIVEPNVIGPALSAFRPVPI